MTEYLKSVLDGQATSVAFKSPDLETITRAGSQRIRRRRAVVLAGVAVVAVLGTVAAVSGLGRVAPQVGSGPWPAESVSWAEGQTIHVGADTIDAGHVVRAYVRTSVGFAVVDDVDDVYSVTTQGVTKVGHLTATRPNNFDQQRLVSDPRGSLVGWVAEDPPGSLVFVAFDQRTGRTRSYPATAAVPPDGQVALFFAIDDRTGYWRTSTGVYSVNLDTGDEDQIEAGPAHDFEVYSAEDGIIAYSPNADTTFFAGRAVQGARQLRDLSDPRIGHIDPVRLSPTGVWLSIGVVEYEGVNENVRLIGITPEVYDTATGERITLDIPGKPTVAFPDVWLDETTVQVVVSDGDFERQPRLSLYMCSVPDGSCALASAMGKFDLEGEFPVLPDGRWWGPR